MRKINDIIALLSMAMFTDLAVAMVVLVVRFSAMFTMSQFVVGLVVWGVTEFLLTIAIFCCADEDVVEAIEGKEEV